MFFASRKVLIDFLSLRLSRISYSLKKFLKRVSSIHSIALCVPLFHRDLKVLFFSQELVFPSVFK